VETYRKHGRKEPYTVIGIKRLPCFRCGKKAIHQWQICSDDRLFRPLCLPCDIELNELVLRWAGFEDWEEKIERYRNISEIRAACGQKDV
jgi:hypothetical protein